MMKKTTIYLIRLYGVKTTFLKTIDEKTWKWVKGEKNTLENIINNNCKNAQERAIQAPGNTFSSMSRLKQYLKDNNLEVIDEFRCMDY
jgi:hypothetical protein